MMKTGSLVNMTDFYLVLWKTSWFHLKIQTIVNIKKWKISPGGSYTKMPSHLASTRGGNTKAVSCFARGDLEVYIGAISPKVHHLNFGHRKGNISHLIKSPSMKHKTAIGFPTSNWREVTYGSKCSFYHTKSPQVKCETALAFQPRVDVRWLLDQSVPSTTQSHLMRNTKLLWPSHLTWTQGDLWVKVSTPPHKVTSCETHHLLLASHLTCSPPCENNIFHLAWKNSQKSHEATPIPSIRYLLRATNTPSWKVTTTLVRYYNIS